MLRSNNARGRIGLLASSSLVASTLMAGMGGVALTAFTPAVALASCTPTAAGTTAGAAANAQGVQSCGAGDTGVYYNATGNLNLAFTGEAVSTNGVGVSNGGAWNVILGINTTTETAGNITNTGGAGVSLSGGTGGSVEIDTGSAALGSFVGATVTGSTDGIDTTTGGSGTTKLNIYNTVTGTTGNGITVTAGAGDVTINALTNTGGNVAINGGSVGIVVNGGGNVTITAPGTVSGGIEVGLGGAAAGDVVINTGVSTGSGAGSNGVFVVADGNITENLAGDTTGTATAFGAGGQLDGASDNFTLTSHGQVINGINVATEGSTGTVTLNVGGNVTGQGLTVGGLFNTVGSASANITLANGNVSGVDPVTGAVVGVYESGPITLTEDAGVDISGAGTGVQIVGGPGNITVSLSGTVGNVAPVAGDGVNISTATMSDAGTITLTTTSVNATGNGIVATNGGSGFTSVTVNGNVTAGFTGINASTDSGNLSNGTGADTVTVAGNLTITAGDDGVDMTVGTFGNATLTLGANDTINSGGAGVNVQGHGAGAINIVTATKDDQSGLIQTTGFLSDGIIAQQNGSATAGINIDFGGNIGTAASNVNGSGIEAEILSAANAGDITVRAGNISVDNGVGVFAATLGSGNISVTTLKGTNVSSQFGDGIDAFGLGGGNVTVTLLDGSINSNTSGSAVAPFPSGGISGIGPTGPTGPDPHGVYMIAVAGGAATLNQNSDVHNLVGDAILSQTVDGANTLNINANVTSTLGDGVHAVSTGTGVVTINLFNAVTPAGEGNQTQNGVTITTTGGSGVFAENTDTTGVTTAQVITTAGAPGPLSVTVTGGLTGSVGVGAVVHSSNVGSGTLASVDLSNAPLGSSISVEGAGANVGVEAEALDGGLTTFAGGASVTTGANLSVSVGTLGGNNDVGVLAMSQDAPDPGRAVSISVGDSNAITVGSVGSSGGVGVYGDGAGTFNGEFSGVPVSVALGNLDTVNVTGSGAVGVEAFVFGNIAFDSQTASVTVGNGGSIVVHDTALAPGYGVLANDLSTGSAPVTVSVGTTSVSVDYGVGIEGISSGSNSVSVTSLGNVTAGSDGLLAVATGAGDASAGYNNTGNASATMDFGGNLGVEAIAEGGIGTASATVTLGNGVGQTTIHGTNTATASTGVLAESAGTGTASITSNGHVTVDPTEFGMVAISPLGQASITTGPNDTYIVSDPLGVAPGHVGLAAASGQVAGTASAVVTIADNNTISVTGLAGNMSGSVGVAAIDDSGGDVVVNTTGSGVGLSITVGGDDSAGIVATTIGGDGVGTFFGTNLGSAGNVTVSTGTGQITVGGTDTTGVDVNNNFANSYGIYAATNGGNISIDDRASITASNGGNLGSVGISAITSGGNGSVFVEVDGAEGFPAVNVTAANYGIRASSTGAGTTTVWVDPSFTGSVTVTATGNTSVNGNLGPVGIWAVGGTGGGNIGTTDGVDVYTNGWVIAQNGRGIVTNSANNADIFIDDFGAVVGLGDATHPVIDVTAPSGATTTITNYGDVMSSQAWFGDEAEFVAGTSDQAIRGTTGSVAIDNEGFLVGRVNLAGLTGTSSATITNGGEWDTSGTTTLAPSGADTITNSVDGLIATSVDQTATTIVFGNMTNTFTNAGELDVGVDDLTIGSLAAPAVTTLSGNLAFVNTGLVVLGASYYGSGRSDRAIDAILDAPGAAWSGTGTLELSANLWSDTQSAAACTSLALTAADCLIVHSTAGNTGIEVLDTQAHAFGAYNPIGIAIVVGSSAANTFHLAASSDYYDGNVADAALFGGHTGVLDKPGLYFYDLAYDSADSTERLIGVPKATVFEFASFAGAMDGLWYTTTQTWFDRTTDQRDLLQGRADGSTQPAVWLKVVGDWTHRDNQTNTFTDYNQSYTYHTSYDQDTAGLLGGVDLLHVAQKNEAWTFGIETGWVQSDLRFGNGSPDTLRADATDLGGYITFLSGGLFVDGVVNANFLTLHDDLPSADSPPATGGAHGTSWGGQVEAGYEMPIGASAFWEPVGSLAYVDTTFGALPVPGGIDQLSGDTSFRGSLGARIGMTQDFQYYKVKVALTGRVWDEFENNPTGTLIVAGGPDFASNDDLKGVFGEVSGQANLFTTTSGLSAFLTGGIKFKSNYNEGTVTLGARYQW